MIDKKIEEMVKRWFGEPVIAVEDEIKSLLKEYAMEVDMGRNWYFEGDELVITRGKWVIDQYKKHNRAEQREKVGEI